MAAETPPQGRTDPADAEPEGAAEVVAPADIGGAAENSATETAVGIPERAIIFIPHLGHADGQSIGNFATRLAARLNQNDRDRPVTYEVGETAHTVRFGRTSPKTTASAVTIVRKAKSGQTSLGIYEFSYSTSFVERFAKKSSWRKAFRLLATVASSLMLLARSFVTGRRPAVAERLKRCVYATAALIVATVVYWFSDPEGPVAPIAALAIAALVLLACFIAVRVARELASPGPVPEPGIPRVRAAVASAIVALSGLPLSAASGWWHTGGRVVLSLGVLCMLLVSLKLGNPDLGQRLQLAGGFVIVAAMALYAILLVGSALGLAWGAVNGGDGGGEGATTEEWAAGITVALAAVGATFSPKSFRTALENGLTHVVGAVRYLSQGEGRESEKGRFYELVEHLAELGVRSIDVVGYSFGSVLALDALYPDESADVPRGTRQVVKRLVTIGCPVVTIGTFWPGYWVKRRPWPGQHWVNVFSPLDILSSNLRRTDCDPSEARAWVAPGDPSAAPPLPDHEKTFSHTGSSATQMKVSERLLAGGLRAHAKYWGKDYAHDLGVVATIGDLWAGADWSGRSRRATG